jgi:phosphatidylinositol alpha-1,6-mannosyltransferase
LARAEAGAEPRRGRGGIALYIRHFLRAVASFRNVDSVVVAPRHISYALEQMPSNLTQLGWAAAGGLPTFALAAARLAARPRRADLIVCGHLHLLPFARALQLRHRCPLLPIIYGIESWQPTEHRAVNRLCRDLRGFVSIRRLSAERLIEWSGMRDKHYYYLPNCIDETAYGLGPKRADLVEKYRLAGRRVVMTAGRLDGSPREQLKGFEVVIRALPLLSETVPNVSHLIMGDGDDLPRLKELARSLRVADRVVFTGYVGEADKPDHLRLADVFAMPGSHPQFDTYPYRFVFLEALACGVPVVGSRLEDAEEAADPDARELIVQVDPHDCKDIVRGILAALTRSGRGISPALARYTYSAFEKKAHAILAEVLEA